MNKNTMKKVLSTIVALMVITISVNAQNEYYKTRHEVGLTIGTAANTQIIGDICDLTEIMVSSTLTTVGSLGTYTGYYSYGDEKYIPTISAEYYYHINKVVGLGGFLAFNGLDRDMLATWKNNETGKSEKQKTGVARRRNLSIIPTAKFDWLRNRNFGMYSKVGAGLTFMHESQKDDIDNGTDFSDTDVIFNFQLSLLGIEAGAENFRGFVELGVGEQGIALAGLRYKF